MSGRHATSPVTEVGSLEIELSLQASLIRLGVMTCLYLTVE